MYHLLAYTTHENSVRPFSCDLENKALSVISWFEILAAISNENAAGEYYLTDAVEVALRKGLKCSAVECPVEEASAANTLEELALLEELLQKRNAKKGK